MRSIARFTAVCLLLATTSSLASAQDNAPKVTAVKCGRLVDVRSGNVVQNAVVLVSNGRITDVGPDVAIPPGAKVVDLSRATVLPGVRHSVARW